MKGFDKFVSQALPSLIKKDAKSGGKKRNEEEESDDDAVE